LEPEQPNKKHCCTASSSSSQKTALPHHLYENRPTTVTRAVGLQPLFTVYVIPIQSPSIDEPKQNYFARENLMGTPTSWARNQIMEPEALQNLHPDCES
ncbi:hypothetical protein STEG23_023954, partial [Scotinomys teguina]